MSKTVSERIAEMNNTFKLPCNTEFTDLGDARLDAFANVMEDELDEVVSILQESQKIDRAVAIADWLADLNVYIQSESKKFGIDLDAVTHIVLDSQESKLDENGQPIMAADGSKFVKGPNYIPPEPKLREYFEKLWNQNK